MIGTIRRNFSKKTLNIIVGVIFLSMSGIMVLFMNLFKRGPGVNTIAHVNGYEITASEFNRKKAEEEHRESMIRQQFGPNAQALFEAFGMKGTARERAFDTLVQQKILLSFADTIGLTLSPEYVSERLSNPQFALQLLGDFIPPQAITEQGVNYKDLLKMLQKRGITGSCLEAIIAERLKGQLVNVVAQGAAYVPEAFVKDEFRRLYQGKKFEVTKIPLNFKSVSAEKPTEEALKKLFDESNDRVRRYWRPEKRTGKVWTFNTIPEDFADLAQPALIDAAAFDEFVKKYDGKESPLGPLERGNELFARRLFSMKDGQKVAFVSSHENDPKASPEQKKGFIITLTSIVPAKERSFEESKADVEKDYRLKAAGEAMAKELQEVKLMDKQKRTDWAKAHNASQATTPFLAPDKKDEWKSLEKEGLGAQQIAGLLQMERPEEKRTVLTPENGYLVELVELEPLNQKQFEEKRGDIFTRLMAQDMQKVAGGFIASLEKNAKIKSNKSLFNRP